MKRPLCSLAFAAGLLNSKGVLFYPLGLNPTGVSVIQGTAVNSTQVIGAGAGATAVTITNGTQTALFGVGTGTIDAGQYNDAFTMYLDNSGNLRLIDNATGAGAGQFSFGWDTFGVSGAINVGGTLYCVVAGTGSGVRALNLTDGSMTALGTATNYSLTSGQGLDAFLRPGGVALSNVVVGILRVPGTGDNNLDIYTNGVFCGTLDNNALVNNNIGNHNDVSFDVGHNSVWFGAGNYIYDQAFDFSAYAVTPPGLAVSVTNGSVVVNWTGRTLAASTTLTNWSPVATAPASATQLFPPPPYAEPLTNATRFFRAAW